MDSVTESKAKQIRKNFDLFTMAKVLLDNKRNKVVKKAVSIKKIEDKIIFTCTRRAFKFASYGQKANGHFFGASGVDNILPLLLEADLCSELLPFISSVELLHKYSALSVLAKFSFKLPIFGERFATVHYQIFDNVETDGAI